MLEKTTTKSYIQNTHTHKHFCFFQPSSLHNFQWKLRVSILSGRSLKTWHDILIWCFWLVFFTRSFAPYRAQTKKIESLRKKWKFKRGKERAKEVKGNSEYAMNCIARISNWKCISEMGASSSRLYHLWTCWKCSLVQRLQKAQLNSTFYSTHMKCVRTMMHKCVCSAVVASPRKPETTFLTLVYVFFVCS